MASILSIIHMISMMKMGFTKKVHGNSVDLYTMLSLLFPQLGTATFTPRLSMKRYSSHL